MSLYDCRDEITATMEENVARQVRKCRRCKNIVSRSELLDEYEYSCHECDEDLYTFETYLEDDVTSNS